MARTSLVPKARLAARRLRYPPFRAGDSSRVSVPSRQERAERGDPLGHTHNQVPLGSWSIDKRQWPSTRTNPTSGRETLSPPLILLLCGYFDTGYLGYEAAEGIDWVWEHRIGDVDLLGI